MKILIVKTSSLGDMLQVFPSLFYLKKIYPDSEIDWVVEKSFSEVVEKNPFIKDCLLVDTKKWRMNFFRSLKEIFCFKKELKKKRYDLLFDFQGNTKSALITFFARASKKIGFGRKSVPEFLNLLSTDKKINVNLNKPIIDQYLDLVKKALNADLKFKPPVFSFVLTQKEKKEIYYLQSSFNEKKKILVAPFSNWKNKMLSDSLLLFFLKKMERKNIIFLFTWANERERSQAQKWIKELKKGYLLPFLSLPEIYEFMKFMQGILSVDSSLLHLSHLADLPSFSFFGPSKGSVYAPQKEKDRHVQGACNVRFFKRCPYLRTCKSPICINYPNLIITDLQNWINKI